MRKAALGIFLLSLFPAAADAEGAAPEMFGVKEIVVEYAHFGDAKSADTCGLSREQIAQNLVKILAGAMVPAVLATDAKPPSQGVARIELVPEVDSSTNETFDCVSSVSLSAESHANVVVPPVTTLRAVTISYWRQHTMVSSGQSLHAQQVGNVIEKMGEQFAQQYRLDQPPEIAK